MNLLRPASCVLRQGLRAASCGLRELGRVLALILVPTIVLAHAYLERSSPRAGEKLAAAPKQLVLIFSRRVELAVTSVELWTVDSIAIPASPPKVHPTEKAGIVVDLPALSPREYRVRWRTTSADGHPIQGSFRFTLLPPPGSDSATARVEAPAHQGMMDSAEHMAHVEDSDAVSEGLRGISIPRTVVRWLSFLSLFAAVGAAAFASLVLPRLRVSALAEPSVTIAIERSARAAGVLAATAVAVLTAPRLYSASAALVEAGSPAIMTYVSSTATGRALLAQLLAAVIAVLGFTIASRSRRLGDALSAAGMLGVLVATSYEGHAAAVDSPILIGTLTTVHILASSVWSGMLLIVVVVAIPQLLRSSAARPVPGIAALIGIFSPIALVCGISAAAVGVVLGVLHIGSFAALVRSDYGRTLLVKVAIVMLVFGTGLYNWRRMKPALADASGPGRLVRSATTELVLGALVLAATAVLVALPSPASLAP